MQFQRRKIRQPYQRRPDRPPERNGSVRRLRPLQIGRRLHPVGLVHGRVLLEKRFAVHAVGITLAGQRPPRQMRNNRRRDPDVVVDHLFLGESGGGIQHLLQVRQLEMLALNFDGRIGHPALLVSHCAL